MAASGGPVSFVAELKQRKVFRVATVYLVVAWVAVQAASIALPAFDAPAWVLRVVILLIALGFPFALVLSWALDVTPGGVRVSPGGAGTKRVAVVAGLLAALALVWFFRGQPALQPADTATPKVAPAASAPEAAAPARSVAVLPFVNMSGDPANEYFSDGIAETTLDMLAQVPDLKVVARTSSFAFKGKPDDVRRIGAALGAATLLEGSVQRAGDAVRITAQLVKATDGTHLWSKHFDRQLADVFKIQDEVATEVVHALQVSLPAADQQRLTQKRTENVAAYEEYFKGIALMPNRKVADMREALAHFERAIELDAEFAHAYVAAADAYHLLDEYGHISADESKRASDDTQRALALAPGLGEAHATRGAELQNAGDTAGAEREFRRATELAPSYATGFQWYGELLIYDLHDFRRSEELLRRAVALDPLSPIVRDQLISPLIASNQLDAAQSELDRLLREHPDFAEGYRQKATLAVARGDLVAALRATREHAERDPEAMRRLRWRCDLLVRFGAATPARDCLVDLAKGWPEGASGLENDILMLRLRGADAQTRLDQGRQLKSLDPVFEAYLLLSAGHDGEALALLQKAVPQVFAANAPDHPSPVPVLILAGLALKRSGDVERGGELLMKAANVFAEQRANPAIMSSTWWDVIAYALLDDRERAIGTLQRGIAAGCFLDIDTLDTEALLAGLRADPRYEATVAPARAKAAQQVAAAEAAGLLVFR